MIFLLKFKCKRTHFEFSKDHRSFVCSSYPAEDEILPCDQYDSLWSNFLASLQTENENSNEKLHDEQQKSVITTTTEDDDQDDDPEFHLPETDCELEDDLGEELHVSSRLIFAIILGKKIILFCSIFVFV